MKLALKNVVLPLANVTLEVDLEITSRLTVIFGPSGSGKTSLLDLIAGLRQSKSALIQIDDDVLTDTAKGVNVPTRQRGIGYVPQDLALFPHLSVKQNLLYGMRADGKGRITFDQIVRLLEIEPLLHRSVTQLSGGEKQRVALGRALLASPRLLLLDEPLASLDLPLKRKILPYLARIRDEFAISILYVTHDRMETLTLAEHMIVLLNGKVVQTGPVQEIFSHPANLDVAGIFMIETVQPGRIVKTSGDIATVTVGQAFLFAVIAGIPPGSIDVHVCIRADDVVIVKGTVAPSSARNNLKGSVRTIVREGNLMRMEIDCGFPLTALVTPQACEDLSLKTGDEVVALIKAQHVHLIPR